ncbi:ubiquinone biosynthesis O-methyltransferase [Sporormia fimetaria CBS 119925]|uniref:Ubiquinone biosynthesis O-methyltransferase, mitochondrial n=1 Tax=Sporormia fimetaria CBS 119925 TaxID=1340428 RepID=A0A6A6V574_9PLEO|nr:ubiquinone biosynthesis O-methyltransferase [Sporormia fimetaria CBS 119925]
MPPSRGPQALRSALRLTANLPRRRIQQQPYIPTTLRHHTTTTFPNSSQPPPNSNSSSQNSSIDPTEITHFNALASSWWDPHGPSRLLHLMNPLRHEFIARCRSSVPCSPVPSEQKLRYLDIGCGGGIFAESAARLPHTSSVTAIDPTPEVLRIAEGHKRRDPLLMTPGRLTYKNISIEGLAVPETETEKYDIVSVFEVLEHVSSPAPFLEQVMKQVKPGGWLVLSTIARTWTSWVVTNVVAEDVLGIVPKGTHEWSKYVNEGELREWFARQEGWGGQGGMRTMGVMYVPGLGWKEVTGSEGWGNYFFGVRRDEL